MTEHAAVIFVFFFLAEYASIVLICILVTLLFLGGYLYSPVLLFIPILTFVIRSFDGVLTSIVIVLDVLELIFEYLYSFINQNMYIYVEKSMLKLTYNLNHFRPLEDYIEINGLKFITTSDPLIEGILYGLTLGLKTSLMVFVFI